MTIPTAIAALALGAIGVANVLLLLFVLTHPGNPRRIRWRKS
jgi:hypothetical protein